MSRLRANRGDSARPPLREWRWWGLYSRRHFVTAAVALGIAIIAVIAALSLLSVADPPSGKFVNVQNPQLDLSIADVPPSALALGLTTFDVVGIEIAPTGCGNPVHVTVLIGLHGSQSRPSGKYVGGQGFLSVHADDPTRSMSNFRVGVVSRREYGPLFDGGGNGEPFAYLPTKTQRGFPSNVPGALTVSRGWTLPATGNENKELDASVDGWFAETAVSPDGVLGLDEPDIALRFSADWASSRSYGTCYVRLPDVLTGTLHNKKKGLVGGTALVQLYPPKNATVDTAASTPTPSDPRSPTWTCRIEPDYSMIRDGCGGFAVLQTPGAGQRQQLLLLVVGAVLGLALAIAAEALLQWNWPLPDRTAPTSSKT